MELVERLIGKGYDLKVYDEEVSLARLVGANRKYIESAIPHIATLMDRSMENVIKHSEVVLIAKPIDPRSSTDFVRETRPRPGTHHQSGKPEPISIREFAGDDR